MSKNFRKSKNSPVMINSGGDKNKNIFFSLKELVVSANSRLNLLKIKKQN